MPKRPDFSIKLAPAVLYYSASNGTTNKTSWGNRAGILVNETTTGTSRRKPKSQWINPTAYTFTRNDWRGAYGYATYMPNGVPNTNGDKYTGIVGVVPGDSSSRFDLANYVIPVYSEASAKGDNGLRNTAYIAALNKLKTTNVDLGIAFAERKQTTKLVGDTATRIARSFNHLKRGSVRKAMDELGISSKRGQPRGSNVPNKWLELQYGYNPLLADVYGACDSLAKRNKDDWRITAKATRSLVYVKDDANALSNSVHWMQRGVYCKKSVFVRIDATPTNELLISLSSLGVLNPLNVVWERVPYSFVVDWFLPIGSYLDSLDALIGYSVRGSSSSLLVEAEWYTRGIGKKKLSNGAWVDNNWTGGRKMVYLNRLVGIAGSLPSFPRPKDPRSLGHMANGLALLASAFGRR